MKLNFPGDVLYMEDGGPKRCGRCIHLVNGDRCELFRSSDKVSAADGVCGLYVNGEPKASVPLFAGLVPATTGYGADKGVGGYSCGNCKYGGERTCTHPVLPDPKIDNVGGCCNIWDYPAQWPKRPPVRVQPRTVRT